MSRKSEYTLDLIIHDDNARDKITDIQQSLKSVSKAAASADLFAGLDKAEAGIAGLFERLKTAAEDTSLDFDKVLKEISKSEKKAIGDLEKQYAQLRARKREGDALSAQKSELIAKSVQASSKEQLKIAKEIEAVEQKLVKMRYDDIDAAIKRNRLLRADIKISKEQIKITNANAKIEDNRAKLEAKKNMRIREKLKFIFTEQKSVKRTIKEQKAYVKVLEQGKKIQEANVRIIDKVISRLGILKKAAGVFSSIGKSLHGATQFVYNAAGLVGGAGRMVKGVGRAVGGVVGSVVHGAEKEVEKEHAIRRIKGGLSEEEKRALLVDLYIKTGADYTTIVEAIGRVQSVLGTSVSRQDLHNATFSELLLPGAAAMIRQSNSGEQSVASFIRYNNRIRAIQTVTGASQEQITASAEKIANMRQSSFSNASMTDLQSVYLSLQNSGAYDNQDELDSAFNAFVRAQKNSKNDVFTHAQSFDWQRYSSDQTNKRQVSVALRNNIDWGVLKTAAGTTDDSTIQRSDAETLAAKMRLMEEEKNKLLMKLIPAVMPLVEGLTKIIEGETGQKLIQGMADLFTTIVPILGPVFKVLKVVLDFVQAYILKPLKSFLEWISQKFGSADSMANAVSGNARANGGIIFGPALVGERAFQPEMILPLDYSRSVRAGNIVSNVNQTFNMAGSETSALSLAQAVKSRDFRLATSQTEFLLARGGLL